VAITSALGGAIGTAIAMIGLHRLSAVRPELVVMHFSAVSTILALGLFLFSMNRKYVVLQDERTLLILASIGVAGTLGQLTMTRAFRNGNPGKISIVGLMQILFVILLDLLFWQRSPDVPLIIGTTLVIGSCTWIIFKNRNHDTDEIHCTSS